MEEGILVFEPGEGIGYLQRAFNFEGGSGFIKYALLLSGKCPQEEEGMEAARKGIGLILYLSSLAGLYLQGTTLTSQPKKF